MDATILLERIRSCAMPEGAVECRSVWLRQQGEICFAPGRRWLPFRAEQWLPSISIEFRWRAWVRLAPMAIALVVDRFEGGMGMLRASIFGCIPIALSRGPATDKGEAMRALAELPWRPFVFHQAPQSLKWEAAGADKLRAVFDDGRTQAAVEFNVDSQGHVLGAAARSRPRMVGKSLVETPWSGSFTEYRMFDGIRVPTMADVTWHLPEGPFTYWRGRVTEFRVLR
jgi:hypothetical protein